MTSANTKYEPNYKALFFWLAILAVISAGAGFWAGKQYGEYKRQPLEIGENCAHYDMKSGHFTWGPAPEILHTTSIMEDFEYAVTPSPTPKKIVVQPTNATGPAPKPQHKPGVIPTTSNGGIHLNDVLTVTSTGVCIHPDGEPCIAP